MVSNFKMLILCSGFCILSSAFEPNISSGNILKIVSSTLQKFFSCSSFMMPPYNSLVAFILLLSLAFVIYILLLLCQILLGSMCILKETMESMEAQNS